MDTYGFTTILEAEVPRIQCPDHGVKQVLDRRKKKTLKTWLAANQNALGTLASVSMDMWDAYIGAVRESIP
ncbi:MAG: transposase, partial [Rectinema subterraneum]